MIGSKTLLEHVIDAVRQLIVAALVVGGLVLVFSGQSAQERQLQSDTLHANLAQACVLSLPVDPVTGRDPKSVKQCFTQYNLQPPSLVLQPRPENGPEETP